MDGTSNGQERAVPWRMIFRVVRWTGYGAAAVALILVMHNAPAPVVETNPQAAARVEQKFEEAQQAVSAGQPATMRMDQTELNSYLVAHLDIASNPPNGAGHVSNSSNVYASNGGAGASSASSAPAQNAVPSSNGGGSTDSPGGTPSPALPEGTSVEEVQSAVKDVRIELIDDRAKAYVVFDFHGKDMTLQLEGRLAAENGYLRFEPVAGQLGSLPIPQSTLETAVRRLMDSPENREKLRLPEGLSGLKIENGEVVVSYK
jgi:hypothetical protein